MDPLNKYIPHPSNMHKNHQLLQKWIPPIGEETYFNKQKRKISKGKEKKERKQKERVRNGNKTTQ